MNGLSHTTRFEAGQRRVISCFAFVGLLVSGSTFVKIEFPPVLSNTDKYIDHTRGNNSSIYERGVVFSSSLNASDTFWPIAPDALCLLRREETALKGEYTNNDRLEKLSDGEHRRSEVTF